MANTCGAKAKSTGNPCLRPAGWGTDHAGFGRCKFHGGKSPIKHGRYSIPHRQALQAKVEEFLSDTRPGDLTHELAMMRALYQDYLERVTDLPIGRQERDHAFQMAESIGKMAERINRMLNETALTQAELLLLQDTLSRLLVKYIDDPERRIAFVGELRQALGSGRSDHGAALPGAVGEGA